MLVGRLLGRANLLICCLLLLAAGAHAASNASTNSDVVVQLQTRVSENQLELGRLLAAQTGSSNGIAGATQADLIEYQLILQATGRAYERQLEELSELDALRQRQLEVAQTAKSWAGFDEPPPHSLLLVDSLRDSAESLQAGIETAQATVNMFEKLGADTRELLNESETRLRRLTEAIETGADPARTTSLLWQRTMEQARNRLAGANVALYERRRQRGAAEAAENRQRLELVRRQLVLASQQVRFSQADLEKVLGVLEASRQEAQAEYELAGNENAKCRQALTNAQQELRQALAISAGPERQAPAVNGKVAALQQRVELRAAQAETAKHRLNLVRLRLDLADYERGLWQMRFATFESRSAAALEQGSRKLETMQRFLNTAKPYFTHQLNLAARQLLEEQQRSLPERAAVPREPDIARQWLDCLRQREAVFQGGLRSLEKTERLLVRWKESLEQARHDLPLGGRLRDLFSDLSSAAGKLWNFELLTAEDTITVDGQTFTGRRSITVGKVVKVIFILAVGFWLAALLARLVERLTVSRLGIEPNQAKLIRRWARIVLVLLVVIISLVWVKIPLTIFAFLGGALALGLGFGMQTMLKNFISGIIILFERPFRVGDVIGINGQSGTVTSIGIRASILQIGDGTETLVPNSTLLENSLTNWTYSNRTVRSAIAVVVASDSDTRRVAQLLLEAAGRHGLILKEPKPEVLFKGFEDNGFAFELRYWLDVHKHDTAQVGSDLRHMIAGAFAEHEIVISFPQRDLHFDANFPLRVQLARTEPAGSAGPKEHSFNQP